MITLFSEFEYALMRQLLDQSQLRLGLTTPNPVTAAAVVSDGEIVGMGIHQRAGEAHAEVLALSQAGTKAKGATLYVTLEPCTHHGRTPPCTDAIVAAGISRVVFAMSDPNPLVQKNRAQERLQAAGIRVEQGLCARQATLQNAPFVINQVLKRPFVTLKVGSSLDGKIALENGVSRYITGAESLQRVHQLRCEVDAIVIGLETVRLDDPSLTIRHGASKEGRPPYKVILDPEAKWSVSGALLDNNPADQLVWCVGAMAKLPETLPDALYVLRLPVHDGHFEWSVLLSQLSKELDAQHILLEGGAGVYSSALAAGVVDRVMVFIAPKLLGGAADKSWLSLPSHTQLSDAVSLAYRTVETLDPDILVTGFLPDAAAVLKPLLAEDR